MKGLRRCVNFLFLLSALGTLTFGLIEVWAERIHVFNFLLLQSWGLLLLVSSLTIVVLRLNHPGGDG